MSLNIDFKKCETRPPNGTDNFPGADLLWELAGQDLESGSTEHCIYSMEFLRET